MMCFSSEDYLRMLLRKTFCLFEGYMDPVLKSIAEAYAPWQENGTWLQELQCGFAGMIPFMQRDNEWDAYTISQCLKYHMAKVYIPSSAYPGDDEKTEILRNNIHHVGFTRNLLSHSGLPSIAEMLSCISAARDVCAAFPNRPNETVN